jgi:acylphosphatase
MQRTMIYRYLKEEKIEIDIDGFTHNNKDGYITIEFKDHEKAKQYYDRANFKDKILFRPFNIYFNVQLNENEMKKYYFDGVTE